MTFKERYLEEEVKFSPGALKTMLIASAGGALGAGLDLYLNGHVDPGDFVKPMSAWAAGGALGGLSLRNDEDEENKEEINKLKSKK